MTGDQASEVMRSHNRIKKLLETWEAYQDALVNLKDNKELTRDSDVEIAAMAQDEVIDLEKFLETTELEIQYALLPHDTTEDRDAIIEIRAGTGGDEASLFVGTLHKIYVRFAENNGLKIEQLEVSPSEVGGYKEIIFRVSGEEVFRKLKYESGVHRVQRVPDTETQGRIHTSTATVAVLPEAEEIDIALNMDELRIEACRAGGPGGQHVNTTDSAVQVLHIPTGIMVRCQDGRSQIKNKEKALSILRSKLFEAKKREEAEKYSAQRKSLIGSGGREEKIRTYNFPQSRVTDHRIGLTLYNLDGVTQGQIEEFIASLQANEIAVRLKEEEIL